MVLAASVASAQTVIQVPYDAAQIVWAPPIDPPADGAGITRWHAINCGAADIRIELPATSVQISTVAPMPGSYACTLLAVNKFGKSSPAPVPPFEAGHVPATPDNTRLEVH